MFQLKVGDSKTDVVIETDLFISSSDRHIEVLLDRLQEFKTACSGLTSYSYKFVADKWVYKFEANSRVFKSIVVPAPARIDFTMTFDCPDPWKIVEFSPHREVRDLLFDLQVDHQLTRFLVTWS